LYLTKLLCLIPFESTYHPRNFIPTLVLQSINMA
jgi:hypothetical protein